MQLVAIADKIIIEKSEIKQDDDIIIPEGFSSNEKQKSGVVLSVGPGRRFTDGSYATPGVVPGDVIYYNPFGVTVLKHEDREYLILTENDILAVIK